MLSLSELMSLQLTKTLNLNFALLEQAKFTLEVEKYASLEGATIFFDSF